jgi:hypothetical protein
MFSKVFYCSRKVKLKTKYGLASRGGRAGKYLANIYYAARSD